MAKVLRWPPNMEDYITNQKPRRGLLGFLSSILAPKPKFGAKGSEGEKKVAWELAEKLGESWIIINNLKLNLGTIRTEIDHLVLGTPGIFCLETKTWNTAACNSQGEWFIFQNRMWVPQKSPVEQNLVQVRLLEEILRQIEPGVSVQGVIVFSTAGNFNFSEAKLAEKIKVYGLPGLIDYLTELEKNTQIYTPEQINRFSKQIFNS